MKEILYGSNDKEPHTETVAQLAQELYNSGLLIALVENLQVIDFEVSREEFRLAIFMSRSRADLEQYSTAQHWSRRLVISEFST